MIDDELIFYSTEFNMTSRKAEGEAAVEITAKIIIHDHGILK